ncbi:MAG TPA: hypothetical protein VGS19_01400 [Streptosporangiaceae bacterium]|nr:hypothetical protein [Streptosporangiaceae bacterium]
MRFSTSSRKTLLAASLAVGASAVLAVGMLLPGAASAKTLHKPTTVHYWITWYGWPDNSPPGPGIAHSGCHTPDGHIVNRAEGVGTYGFPVTYADPQHLNGPWCQIIYVPKFKKYFMHEDQCNPCGGQNSSHFDLWIGGDRNSTQNPEHRAILNCENTGTGITSVILNPPTNEPVNTTPAFVPPTTCNV